MNILASIRLSEERIKESIPSQVFYNHFFALWYQIDNCPDKFKLKQINYYNNLKLSNQTFDLDTCKKLLWNSWSTEYAFNLASEVGNQDYYKYAFHWNFPQAYYSIYLAMTAFHETQGVANDQHEKSIKLFGNSVKDDHYPKCISFYAKGLHKEFEYIGLDEFNGFPDGFTALSKIHSLDEAQTQIASFLKSTRKLNAENKRDRAKKSNDKRFHNQKGEFRSTFGKKHWDMIYQTIPETTILNMIYRLRIKANYQDIETFVNADIDFQSFHESLGNIIYYLNFVHEAYIHKVIGNNEYEKIISTFKGHLNDNKAKHRYEIIKAI